MGTFRDYTEVNEKILEGYTVVNATAMINAEATGLLLELERDIEGAVLGIDISYDPDCKDGETPLTISNEYLKRVNP